MRSFVIAAAVALLSSGPARAAWQEASSRHFIVYSDDTPEKVKAFTTKLERFDKAMRVMRGVSDDPVSAASRVTVYVVRNVSEVQRLAGRDAGDIAGFYSARAEGSVAFVPRRSGDGSETALTPQAILLHEYAHHWMFSTWGSSVFPGWFVEGFAEFNATAKVNDDGSVQVGLPPLYRAYGITDTDVMPMKRLLTADPNALPEDARHVFYSRAWLLTDYLTLTEDGNKLFHDYLSAINGGKSLDVAAKLLGDGPKLDRKLNTYAMQRTIRTLTLPAKILPVGEVSVRTLSTPEVAIMPARIRSAGGVDPTAAQSVVALARTVAASYPQDPAVQNELAEAEFDSGNYAASQAAADRAIAAGSPSVHALIYRGMAEEAAAAKAGVSDPARWQAIRRWFARANALDHDDAWPLVAFYHSFYVAKAKPTANAETGVIYAHDLAPFDVGLSMEVAGIYLRQGKVDEARATLQPVAYNPHGGGATVAAARALAALDTAGTGAALKVIAPDNPPKPEK